MNHDVVLLPNGATITGVPEGATDDEIKREAIRMGIATESDFPSTTAQKKTPLDTYNKVKENQGYTGARYLEPAVTMITGAIAEPIAGLAGLSQALNPWQPEGAGARAVEDVRKALTVQPWSEEGKAGMQAVGEAMQADLPVIDMSVADMAESTTEAFGESGERYGGYVGYPGAGRAIGESLPAALSMAVGGRPAASAIRQAPELAAKAATAAKPVIDVAGKIAAPITIPAKVVARDIAEIPAIKRLSEKSPAEQNMVLRIKQGTADNDLATVKLDKNDNIVKDKVGKEVVRQGFSEGFTASTKAANKVDKKSAQKMARIRKRGKENKRYQTDNRPTDVPGESIINRYNSIDDVKKQSLRRLDKVIGSLADEKIYSASPVNQFILDLQDMGVVVDEGIKQGGKTKNIMDFRKSSLAGSGPQKAIKDMVSRLDLSGKPPTAKELHEIKKYIDRRVEYGVSKTGEVGNAQGVLKKFRKNIDALLDSQYPDYNAENTILSDTIRSMGMLEDIMGKKINPKMKGAASAVGTKLEGINSNNVNRVPLRNMVEDLTDTANKYGGNFQDDILYQVAVAEELDNVFGAVAGSSFQGRIERAIPSGLSAATGNPVPALMQGVKAGANKLKGINEENAYKAIMKLLNQKD